MIERARQSPTGWLLLFTVFGALGALVGSVVSWAAGWPPVVAVVLGAAIGLLLASRAVARAPSGLAAVGPSVDLSPVRTARLRLRRFTEDDARAEALGATVDAEVADSMGWAADDVSALVAMGSDPTLLATRGFLAIASVEDDVAGVVSLTRTPSEPGAAQLGFWLGPAHRARGLGPEAVALAAELAWGLGLQSVTMGTTATNLAMQRCYSSAGAVLVETTVHELPDGRAVESRWFRIDRPDPAGRP